MNAISVQPSSLPDSSCPQGAPSNAGRDILVVDDHELVRLGLRALLQSLDAEGVQCMGMVHEASSLREAIAVYGKNRNTMGLVMLDLHLPDSHGTAGLVALRHHYPEARVVVLSAQTDPALMRAALEEGAVAFLPKSGDLRQVVLHLRTHGLVATTSATQTTSVHEVGNMPEHMPALTEAQLQTSLNLLAGQVQGKLSQRQTQILERMLMGESNRQIADHICLNEGTVKNHVSAILLLFGVRSRSQLISLLR